MRGTLITSTLIAVVSHGASESMVSGNPVRAGIAETNQEAEIVFTSTRDGNWELYSMKANGSDVRRLTRNSGGHTPSDGWAKWSPDGTEIAYMSDPRSHGVFSVYVMKVHGGGTRRLTPEPARRSEDSEYPTWSPDGTRLAYVSPSSGIYLIDSSGSGKRLLISTRMCDCPISWSPDGTKILFATHQGPSPGIHAVDVGSGETAPVRELSGSFFRPEWSPDGTRIAVAVAVGDSDSESVILVMNADGSDLTEVADNAYRGSVSWSSDGQRLAYSSVRDGDPDIFVIGADGSNPVNITRSPGADFDPHWARRPGD